MLQKLHNILQGWKNYVFESKEIESMAKSRAIECAKCDNAVYGWVAAFVDDGLKDIQGLKCGLCDCPLSGLLRSPESQCKENKWLARTK